MPLRVRLFGPVQLEGPSGISQPPNRIRQGALSVLAVDQTFVSADQLVARCWETPTNSAAGNLRTHIAALRQAARDVGGTGDIIQSCRGAGYRLDPDIDSDWQQMERLLDDAKTLLRAGEYSDSLQKCHESTRLWRGDFGVDLPATACLQRQAETVSHSRRSLAHVACAAQLGLNDAHKALDLMRGTIPEPDRDVTSWKLWIASQFLDGNVSGALQAIAQCRQAFLDLGMDIPPAVSRLHSPILKNHRKTVQQLAVEL